MPTIERPGPIPAQSRHARSRASFAVPTPRRTTPRSRTAPSSSLKACNVRQRPLPLVPLQLNLHAPPSTTRTSPSYTPPSPVKGKAPHGLLPRVVVEVRIKHRPGSGIPFNTNRCAHAEHHSRAESLNGRPQALDQPLFLRLPRVIQQRPKRLQPFRRPRRVLNLTSAAPTPKPAPSPTTKWKVALRPLSSPPLHQLIVISVRTRNVH